MTKRWQAKRWLEFIRNGDAPELSKIDNMRLFRFAYLLLLCLAAAAEAQNSPPATTKTTVFAGGCFWCIQPAFDKAPGVLKTTVGYCGGTEPNPTYALVGSEKTNYRESIQITYDPGKISYEQLLDIYWKQIDPTQSDGQFTDVGPSYRAAIFLWQRRGKEGRGNVKGETGALRQVQKTDCDRDFAGDEILSG